MEFDATFVIAIISFIVFVFIMNAIFYSPILKIMKAREDFVAQNYKEAKETSGITSQKTEYFKSELEKSRNEARGIIAEKTKEFSAKKNSEIAGYKTALSNDISARKDELLMSAKNAKTVLENNVADIASEISGILLGETIVSDIGNNSVSGSETDYGEQMKDE